MTALIRILVVSFVLLSFIENVFADTHYAASCSEAHVTAAIADSSAGDTVIVPACEATPWADTVTVDKGITIQGNTTTSRNGDTYVVTPIDGTIIQNYGFDVTATTGVRITGFTFYGPGVGTDRSAIIMPDSPIGMRIDHNHFTQYRRVWNKKGGTPGNQNILFDNNRITDPGGEGLYIMGNQNQSWIDAGSCGADHPEKTTWLEDNEWVLESADLGNPIDMSSGARVVIRNNLFSGSAIYKWTANIIETHGHCRIFWDDYSVSGAYCLEVSGNKVTQPSNPGYTGQNFMKFRGGRSYVYNNSMSGTGWAGPTVLYYVEETVVNCNSPNACAVQAHEDMGLHAIPLSEAENYTGGLCTTYPCPMQPNNSYSWSNTIVGGTWAMGVQGVASFMQINRDWWDDISGVFTKDVAANRVAGTCTAQDVYWETDTKRLYRCTATNTWTLIYQPYTYPHPLRGEFACLQGLCSGYIPFY